MPRFVCDVLWDDMKGDDERRWCDRCEKFVTNLSEMSRDEAACFLAANPKACRRVLLRADEIQFVEPQLRRQRLGLRHLLAVASIVAPLAACSPEPLPVADAPIESEPAALAIDVDPFGDAAQALRGAVGVAESRATLRGARTERHHLRSTTCVPLLTEDTGGVTVKCQQRIPFELRSLWSNNGPEFDMTGIAGGV